MNQLLDELRDIVSKNIDPILGLNTAEVTPKIIAKARKIIGGSRQAQKTVASR